MKKERQSSDWEVKQNKLHPNNTKDYHEIILSYVPIFYLMYFNHFQIEYVFMASPVIFIVC